MTKIKFEKRYFLIVEEDVEDIDGDLEVALEPCRMVNISYNLSYWFFECLHNGKPRFLEQRIVETDIGQNVTERIVDYLPKEKGA